MMFKKKLLTSAMATALVAGAMLSSGAQATSISNTGMGQLLIGEMYVARTGDYSTSRIKVINSSDTDAVKAKLVFRSQKHSDECRDLILYLTPNDVAYVDVRLNSAGQPEVWSDDDSILAKRMSSGSLTFASQQTGGFTTAMIAPRTEPKDDTCAMGHVEVVAAYSVTGTVKVQDGGTVTIQRGMSKHSLARVFDTSKPALNAANGNLVTNGAGPNGADYTSRVQLKGEIEMSSAADRLRMPMVAVTSGLNSFITTATAVVTNPTFDTVLSSETGGSETVVGMAFGDGVIQPSEMVTDIEGALLARTIHSVYEQGVNNALVTFPTKYRHITAGRYSGIGATYEAPFTAIGRMPYALSLWDNQENIGVASATEICVVSPCPVDAAKTDEFKKEVNFDAVNGDAATGWNPSTGWFRFTLNNVAGTDHFGKVWATGLGAPAVASTHFYKSGMTQSVIVPMGRR